MPKFEAEFTDTFAGEANYSWVQRETFHAPDTATDKTLMRRAKTAVGLNGVRGRWDSFGDTLRFRPYHLRVVLFVSFVDDSETDA